MRIMWLNSAIALVLLLTLLLTTSCASSVNTDTVTLLRDVRIADTSCLTRAEKESLAYNKCVISKAKLGYESEACRKLMRRR